MTDGMRGGGSRQVPYGENENLTLTDADLAATGKRPQPSKGGEVLRYRCPVHGGDRQNSLELNTHTGRFFCHACRCWGYMDWAREEWRREKGLDEQDREGFARPPRARRTVRKATPPPPLSVEPVRDDLDALLARYQEALPGSWGERYLEHRGIPFDVAREYGVGYAAPKAWVGRKWKGGRLVFGHYRPDGVLVNLYGRAVAKRKVPDSLKHDHLPGNKGWFNARAVREGGGPLYVCEAALDALALIAAGHERAIAIFGTYGWRPHWIPQEVRHLVIAADADGGGDLAREHIGIGSKLRGITVSYLTAESYGGEKDASAAYALGKLKLGEIPKGEARDRFPDDGDESVEPDPKPPARDYRAEALAALEAARRKLARDKAVDVNVEATVEGAARSPLEEERERRAPSQERHEDVEEEGQAAEVIPGEGLPAEGGASGAIAPDGDDVSAEPASQPTPEDNVVDMAQKAKELREKRRRAKQRATNPPGGGA